DNVYDCQRDYDQRNYRRPDDPRVRSRPEVAQIADQKVAVGCEGSEPREPDHPSHLKPDHASECLAGVEVRPARRGELAAYFAETQNDQSDDDSTGYECNQTEWADFPEHLGGQSEDACPYDPVDRH